MNVDVVYQTVKKVFDDVDAIYEDYLIYLVGYEGLHILQAKNLIESCGVVEGRKLYTLVDGIDPECL